MQRTQVFHYVRLVPEFFRELNEYLVGKNLITDKGTKILEVELQGHITWKLDTFDEYLAEYPNAISARYYRSDSRIEVDVQTYSRYSRISVQASDRPLIQKIFNIADKFREQSTRLPVPELEPDQDTAKPVVFIGHGRSNEWRNLKDHLQDKHRYKIEAFEVGARAGHSIRDILEEVLDKSSIAFLVFTGEDETADGKMHVRQNVVHEAGLFQGKLGFPRAIIVREDGAEDFSNIAGIQQIRFSKGNIKETFGDVLAVLKREFED
jgi:predicted nucleotide-binding protein